MPACQGQRLIHGQAPKKAVAGLSTLLRCTSCVFGVGGVETMDRQVVEGNSGYLPRAAAFNHGHCGESVFQG